MPLVIGGTNVRFIKEHLISREFSASVSIRHLSRVRRTRSKNDGLFVRELLLCAKESIDFQELTDILSTHTDPALFPRVALASKWRALTLSQYESYSKLWPVKASPERKRYIPTFFLSFDRHAEPFQETFQARF